MLYPARCRLTVHSVHAVLFQAAYRSLRDLEWAMPDNLVTGWGCRCPEDSLVAGTPSCWCLTWMKRLVRCLTVPCPSRRCLLFRLLSSFSVHSCVTWRQARPGDVGACVVVVIVSGHLHNCYGLMFRQPLWCASCLYIDRFFLQSIYLPSVCVRFDDPAC